MEVANRSACSNHTAYDSSHWERWRWTRSFVWSFSLISSWHFHFPPAWYLEQLLFVRSWHVAPPLSFSLLTSPLPYAHVAPPVSSKNYFNPLPTIYSIVLCWHSRHSSLIPLNLLCKYLLFHCSLVYVRIKRTIATPVCLHKRAIEGLILLFFWQFLLFFVGIRHSFLSYYRPFIPTIGWTQWKFKKMYWKREFKRPVR